MKQKVIQTIALTLCIIMLAACGEKAGNTNEVSIQEVKELPENGSIPGEYDSADTAIVTDISVINKTITFYNYELKKTYTLSYDSITRYADKYGTALSIGQLKKGMLADILFLKSGKKLVSLSENGSAFSISDITGFSIDSGAKLFVYKDDSYKITDGTILLSGEDRIELKDLNQIDSVTIIGIDTTIYSLTVDKGHGYLSLKGEDDLMGGYLEIGDRQVELITPNTKYLVPVGSFDVVVTKDSVKEKRSVTINTNEETVLDLSDITIKDTTTGRILFELIPSTAKLLIDGEKVNADELQVLEIGRHSFTASNEGYDSESGYFNVTDGTKTMTVELKSNSTEETETEATVDSSNTAGYYLFISSPSGVEVVYDGNYVGLSPLSLRKQAGNHTITLSKNGCVTKTYSILTENTATDDYLNFEELPQSQTETTGEGNNNN